MDRWCYNLSNSFGISHYSLYFLQLNESLLVARYCTMELWVCDDLGYLQRIAPNSTELEEMSSAITS